MRIIRPATRTDSVLVVHDCHDCRPWPITFTVPLTGPDETVSEQDREHGRLALRAHYRQHQETT